MVFYSENPQKGKLLSDDCVAKNEFTKITRKMILPNTVWPGQKLCPDPLV